MERELFSVEPIPQGWAVYADGAPAPAPTGPEALACASNLAYAHYKNTGRPTGVRVRMRCGDVVLMSPLG